MFVGAGIDDRRPVTAKVDGLRGAALRGILAAVDDYHLDFLHELPAVYSVERHYDKQADYQPATGAFTAQVISHSGGMRLGRGYEDELYNHRNCDLLPGVFVFTNLDYKYQKSLKTVERRVDASDDQTAPDRLQHCVSRVAHQAEDITRWSGQTRNWQGDVDRLFRGTGWQMHQNKVVRQSNALA